MKIEKVSQKLKSKIRKQYVRKKEFESLSKEVKRLTKKLAKLEKCCENIQTQKTEPKTKEKKAETQLVDATVVPKEETPQDKLTLIKGIGPVLEKKLHNLGILRLSQIAGWSEEDIEKISEHLDFKGRIQREEWVQQAKELV